MEDIELAQSPREMGKIWMADIGRSGMCWNMFKLLRRLIFSCVETTAYSVLQDISADSISNSLQLLQKPRFFSNGEAYNRMEQSSVCDS